MWSLVAATIAFFVLGMLLGKLVSVLSDAVEAPATRPWTPRPSAAYIAGLEHDTGIAPLGEDPDHCRACATEAKQGACGHKGTLVEFRTLCGTVKLSCPDCGAAVCRHHWGEEIAASDPPRQRCKRCGGLKDVSPGSPDWERPYIERVREQR